MAKTNVIQYLKEQYPERLEHVYHLVLAIGLSCHCPLGDRADEFVKKFRFS